jgi:hypothetical protein
MPQVVSPPLSGQWYGAGPNGPYGVFFGSGDPNQASTDNGNGDLSRAGIGTFFSRTDESGGVYYKSAFLYGSPGTWTQIS